MQSAEVITSLTKRRRVEEQKLLDQAMKKEHAGLALEARSLRIAAGIWAKEAEKQERALAKYFTQQAAPKLFN